MDRISSGIKSLLGGKSKQPERVESEIPDPKKQNLIKSLNADYSDSDDSLNTGWDRSSLKSKKKKDKAYKKVKDPELKESFGAPSELGESLADAVREDVMEELHKRKATIFKQL